MIIIQVMGGLGNQLQQYALYRKLKKLGKDVKLDTFWFDDFSESSAALPCSKTGIGKDNRGKTQRELELNRFNGLKYETCTQKEKEKLIGDDQIIGKLRRKLLPSSVHWFHETDMYHSEIFAFEDMYLSGYFACEKYFADILQELRQDIQFPPNQKQENSTLAEEMAACESVSVHIRRGDYLSPENAVMFGGICTEEYYRRAFAWIKENCREPHFYLFSDDPVYIEQYVNHLGDMKQQAKGAAGREADIHGIEITVVDVNHDRDSFYDMWLMSRCRHHICANSTFSFWGARLDPGEQKIMIRPTIQKNSQVFDKGTMEELWRGWTFISPQGILM